MFYFIGVQGGGAAAPHLPVRPSDDGLPGFNLPAKAVEVALPEAALLLAQQYTPVRSHQDQLWGRTR
jgi:hypothetical protein